MTALWSTALLLLVARPVAAQEASEGTDTDYGAWLQAFAQGSLGGASQDLRRWRWWFDGHVRFLGDANGYNQTILRPGLGYALGSEVTVWLGYAYVHTDPGDAPQFYENRLWQQFLWATDFDPLLFQSRTRLEQRFLETGSDTGWRLRQFVKLTYPFDFAPRFGIAGFLEAFIDLNDTDWGADAGFAQSRFFAAFFWRLDKSGRATLEAGYLNQFLARAIGPDAVNNILAVNLLISLN